MARQVGLIKVIGKLDGTVTYNLKGKIVTRKIGVVDKEKMNTAPQYETTRKNQSDFAKASKAGQLFRKALNHITKGYTDEQYPIDVMQLMLKALKADSTNPLGQRQIHAGLQVNSVMAAFKKLNIFFKRSTKHFGEHFTIKSQDDGVRSLYLSANHKKIKGKAPVIIRFGYLFINFETMLAQYLPDKLVISDTSKFGTTNKLILPLPIDLTTPWVFIIQEVWQTTQNSDPMLLFMGVADVWEHSRSDK